MRAGIIASVIANVNRDPKKRPEPFAPQDFMPFIERPPDAYQRGMEFKRKFMRATMKKKV